MSASTQTATIDQALDMGLTADEFKKIIDLLGRTPNFTEMCVYSVMWSEHCSYKNSIRWLKTLPKDGPHMLVKAGEENAGLVDIGNGLGCAFKIESHNHPSAIEPYQGAATGVGGINRDIFTMGARPVAQLNSLRFGSLDEPRTQWLMSGVVKGIGDYGNAFGIPVVGGEVYFDPSYHSNCLVNAMSVGLVKADKIISAKAKGPGNPVFIVGSSTGKDGIKGASFASRDITAESAADLPSVQVGDPFQEKLLLEATMELAQTDAIVGMQDMGAAGITCSTSEMSAGGGVGMDIHLDLVPTRQSGMQPFEILLSESQERMLIVVHKGKEKIVQEIFEKWDLNAVKIGNVTESGQVRYFMNGEVVGNIPASSLVLGGGAPVYEREYREPAYFAQAASFNIQSVKEPADYVVVARQLISQPNIASKRWVYEQYDSMVGAANMSTNKLSDAAVVNIKGTSSALVLSVDCNGRYVHADPEKGTMIAVCEAARNIVCSGGEPSAITNCLNFGNPYNPEVYWQFVGAIKGMGKACERLQTPVTGGNVSFYNQTVNADGSAAPVFPTPTIGMLGVMKDKGLHTSLEFKYKGDLIYLLGTSRNDISSSEYLYSIVGVKNSPAPHFDIEEECAVQNCMKDLIKNTYISSAHDVSDGGLFAALCEMGFPNELGFDVVTDGEIRKDAFLFGESQSRILVTVVEDYEEEFIDFVASSGVQLMLLGHVTQGRVTIDGENFGMIADFKSLYENRISNAMNQ
jgi:phosphoribosylformylglycinamidine synthase II